MICKENLDADHYRVKDAKSLAIHLAPVVQRADNSITWIKCTPTTTIFLLGSALSAEKVIHSLNNWSLI